MSERSESKGTTASRFSSSRVLVSLIAAVLVALPLAMVAGTGSASAQDYAPTPTINSVTVSGTSATITYTVPMGENLEYIFYARTATLDEEGQLGGGDDTCDNWSSLTGSGSCTVDHLEAGTYYFQIETELEDTWGPGNELPLGCPPPAGQEASYPDGGNYCESTLHSAVVSSTTHKSTHEPIALLPIVTSIPPTNGTAACDEAIGQLNKDNEAASLVNSVINGINSKVAQADAGGTWTAREQDQYELVANLYKTGWSIQTLGNLRVKDLADAEQWCSAHAAVRAALTNNIFQPLPVPSTNGSAVCNADISKINYDNTMLSRAFGQLSFRAQSLATNFDQLVPNQQLWTRIAQLDGQLTPVWSTAWTKDCNKS